MYIGNYTEVVVRMTPELMYNTSVRLRIIFAVWFITLIN